MFSQALVPSFVLLAISSVGLSKPLPKSSSLFRRTDQSSSQPVSFNNYQGLSSMAGFDNFYGVDNFSGSSNSITVEQQTVKVCHPIQVEVIQQQLVVMREYVKKLITEQVCDVETQTVVLQQFSSGVSDFSQDVRHKSGKPVAYDSNVANMINKITPDQNGNLNSNNLGFSGQSVGSNAVQVQGSNWNDATSPNSTDAAFQAAKNAAKNSKNSSNNKSSTSTSSASSSTSSSAASSSATSSASSSASSSAASPSSSSK